MLYVRHMILKYLVVGILCTGLDAGIFILLTAMGIPVVHANPISYGAGIILHFFLNRGWTFYDPTMQHNPVGLHRLIVAIVWGMIGIWISTGMIYLLQPLAGTIKSKIITIPLMIGLNFLASRYIIFRSKTYRP